MSFLANILVAESAFAVVLSIAITGLRSAYLQQAENFYNLQSLVNNLAL